jgi:hypothetical protein
MDVQDKQICELPLQLLKANEDDDSPKLVLMPVKQQSSPMKVQPAFVEYPDSPKISLHKVQSESPESPPKIKLQQVPTDQTLIEQPESPTVIKLEPVATDFSPE